MNINDSKMDEFRCEGCNRLLCKYKVYEGKTVLQGRCKRCSHITTLTIDKNKA